MSALPLSADGPTVRRRFLLLRALRWLPTGLLMPVLVLLLLERGLSLAELGVVTAAQGAMVFLLELPTGGLADALGRRRVLLVATAFELAAVGLLMVADTLPLLALVFALQGVYRALESGPLDAWYVDAAQATDPDADIEGGLAAGGVVTGLAISVGTLVSGGLVAADPVAAIDPLVVPLVIALILRCVEFVAIVLFMAEVRAGWGSAVLARSVRRIPGVVRGAVRLVTTRRILLLLVSAELLWGFGMIAFETFTPPRLADVLTDRTRAAAVMGPTNAVGWLLSAGGAALAPVLTRRVGGPRAAATMLLGQGVAVAGIALAAGPVGVVVAFLATMTVHGAANPVHQGMLHRAAPASHRATVLSANSMAGHVGGAVGGIALGALAGAVSLPIAMLAGAGLLAVAAGLYVLAGRSGQPTVGGVPHRLRVTSDPDRP